MDKTNHLVLINSVPVSLYSYPTIPDSCIAFMTYPAYSRTPLKRSQEERKRNVDDSHIYWYSLSTLTFIKM